MIAAIVNVPDPGGMAGLGNTVDIVDVADSPYPLASLGVAVAAAAIAGLILAPLDIVRTKYAIPVIGFLFLLTLVQVDHDIYSNTKKRLCSQSKAPTFIRLSAFINNAYCLTQHNFAAYDAFVTSTSPLPTRYRPCSYANHTFNCDFLLFNSGALHQASI
jgi:hypothetical protein